MLIGDWVKQHFDDLTVDVIPGTKDREQFAVMDVCGDKGILVRGTFVDCPWTIEPIVFHDDMTFHVSFEHTFVTQTIRGSDKLSLTEALTNAVNYLFERA